MAKMTKLSSLDVWTLVEISIHPYSPNEHRVLSMYIAQTTSCQVCVLSMYIAQTSCQVCVLSMYIAQTTSCQVCVLSMYIAQTTSCQVCVLSVYIAQTTSCQVCVLSMYISQQQVVKFGCLDIDRDLHYGLKRVCISCFT